MRDQKSPKDIGFGLGFLLVLLAVDFFLKDQMTQIGQVVWNRGGVFGWGEKLAWLPITLSLSLVALGLWWGQWSKWGRWGLIFILSGGLGNVLDRWRFGAVRDYIYYPGLKVYGNLADIFLGIGIILIIWGEWRRR